MNQLRHFFRSRRTGQIHRRKSAECERISTLNIDGRIDRQCKGLSFKT